MKNKVKGDSFQCKTGSYASSSIKARPMEFAFPSSGFVARHPNCLLRTVSNIDCSAGN
jgi:hypothetical protein